VKSERVDSQEGRWGTASRKEADRDHRNELKKKEEPRSSLSPEPITKKT